jgi:DNA mismatch repair protein MutS2
MMDAKYLNTLELPIILERLARFTAFSTSTELARTLTPSTSYEEVARRQGETREARFLLDEKTDLSIGGARDVRSEVRKAERGVVLEPTQLLDVKSMLVAARTMRRLFDKKGQELPRLSKIAEELQISHGLIDAISKTLDERGEILETASETLIGIRRKLKIVHDRLTDKLQRMINNPKIAPMLQEPIITQRDGRFVLPLQADFRSRMKAIVHDQSASGATLFVEPLQVVDLNNDLRELQLAERDEIRRILAELSARVGEAKEEIIQTVEALGKLDLAFAKARYAESLDANEPVLKPFQQDKDATHPGSTLRLLDARHPLLDPAQVVPVDLILDGKIFALVITGPNTGGKTVTLKTAGLLACMAQCGLQISAASGSELSVFDGVYADIGDEQSIEQSLSTFSAHITNIIRILRHAGDRSLVLLDELGAGTDPQEGAALARAILSMLVERGITTLVATHYPEMKVFAHNTEGVRNASVEFDLESLEPTYHLTIGLPGRSNALSIAQRLGLPQDVVDRARGEVSPDDLRAETLLDEIHHQRDAARQEMQAAREAREQVEELQDTLSERLQGIEDERREILAVARSEAGEELTALHDQLRKLRQELAIAGQPLDVVKVLEGDVKELEEKVAQPLERRSIEPIDPGTFGLGDRVHLRTIGADGVITDLNGEQAEVQVGRLRVRASLNELGASRRDKTDDRTNATERAVTEAQTGAEAVPTLSTPPLELDLRGYTVEEALEALDYRLDSAYLAGSPYIRVIHGKGSGRLRQAVRQALKGNRYVQSFEVGKPAEGGDGVTVVRLSRR